MRPIVAFGIITALVAASSVPADDALIRIYHSDPDHLWNRVHDALMTRTGPDGVLYGQDRLEPLLWADSKYLTEGSSADRAIDVLTEFLKNHGEALINDPLKRAILQRDLWLVFNWLAQNEIDAGDVPRARLAGALAEAIQRLAMTSDQIARLPDNYAAAVATKDFATRFDEQFADRAYLPPDLFDAAGPWVCVGRTDGPTAPLHVQTANVFNNSVFYVFLKLSEDRRKTVEFVQQFAACKSPLLIRKIDSSGRRVSRQQPDLSVPQLPRGTELALVRRALLIDQRGNLVGSPLTESVQLRVICADTGNPTANDLENSDINFKRARKRLSVFDIQFRRANLFANRAGLRDVSSERDFKTGFGTHGWDMFDVAADSGSDFLRRSQPVENRQLCINCHHAPGIYGTMSFQRYQSNDEDSDNPRPLYPVAVMTTKDVEQAAITWKESQTAWKSLRKLWNSK